jgi:hypothetical protein
MCLQYDLGGKCRLPKLDNLHRSAMMCGSRPRRLYALSEIVFYAVEDDGCVVYRVYLGTEELHRHAPCQTLSLSAMYPLLECCRGAISLRDAVLKRLEAPRSLV